MRSFYRTMSHIANAGRWQGTESHPSPCVPRRCRRGLLEPPCAAAGCRDGRNRPARRTEVAPVLEDVREFYMSKGFGGRVGFGERPATVVIDMARSWLDESSPLG